MKYNHLNKKGANRKTATIMTALVIIVAGIGYTSFSGNSPLNNAKIAKITAAKEDIKTSINNYIYSITSKDFASYTSSEDIICGFQGEGKNIDGIVDINVTYVYDDIILYRLDEKKCKEKLDLDISKVEYNGGQWYIDIDGNPYLVFNSYDEVSNFIKKDMEKGSSLNSIVKY